MRRYSIVRDWNRAWRVFDSHRNHHVGPQFQYGEEAILHALDELNISILDLDTSNVY